MLQSAHGQKTAHNLSRKQPRLQDRHFTSRAIGQARWARGSRLRGHSRFLANSSNEITPGGKVPKIDLFLYSWAETRWFRGGSCSMIREHCDSICRTCAVQSAQRRDDDCTRRGRIVMSDLSELSPIDPSPPTYLIHQTRTIRKRASRFRSKTLSHTSTSRKISLASRAMKISTRNFPAIRRGKSRSPSARARQCESHSQSHPAHRQASCLRATKADERRRDRENRRIFHRKLYCHQYFIGRREAHEELGVKSVVDAPANRSKSDARLYESYRDEIGLGIGHGTRSRTRLQHEPAENLPVATSRAQISRIASKSRYEFRRHKSWSPANAPGRHASPARASRLPCG